MTVGELSKLVAEHMAAGRESSKVMLDRRGLYLLRLDCDVSLDLGVPPRSEAFSAGKVYLHILFDK